MSESPAVLVTGANGFVGRALCRHLIARGLRVRGAMRGVAAAGPVIPGLEPAGIGEVGPDTDWRGVLAGMELVVHLAARVHLTAPAPGDQLALYRQVNTRGTERLARQAAAAGVRRLVFLSSVKVNGEGGSRPYTEEDEPAPVDPYGVSKLEAEQALRQIAAATGLEIVVLRPPLVFGPGVRANFRTLLAAAARGLPLPLASVDNRRSMIYVENLADAILTCLVHPAAAGKTYLVSDGEDLSVAELYRRLCRGMGKRPRLLPVPAGWLVRCGRLLGREALVTRLTGSLQVDASKITRELAWRPPFSLAQGLAETVRWYRALDGHEEML